MSEHAHPTIVPHAGPKPRITVRATWEGEHRFDTGRPDGPVARFDGSARTGQNPVDALVSALATCVGIDVVDILGKRRTPPSRLVIDAHAERRAEHPRRVERVTMHFVVDGDGIEIAHTERAIALALEKYCSVAATLATDVVVETRAVVNGEAGALVMQANAEAARG
ncbi:MAG TPA: OsmC family protein [Gemmatimonadaceae bacterium]